ncbi:MAG: armadillo-type protein [Benniella sp.]|nr:MAG: armadillo-type protein [Benniella sp.]
MSNNSDQAEKAKELLLTFNTSKDVQPSLITDLSSALIGSLANADTEDKKAVVRTQQKEFLERSTELLALQPSEGDDTAKGGDPILQAQGAILKSLVRMVMDDVPFTDALFDSKVYPAILRLPGTVIAPTTGDTKSPPPSSKKNTAQDGDLKPMVVILLAKSFETASNKDRVRDRSAEIVLADIGSDKIKTRTRGFQALGIIVQADMSIGCGILNKEGLLVELMDCIDTEPENIQIILTETLSMACAEPKTRTAVGLHCSEFLKSIVLRGATKNQHLKGAAAVTLTKISMADSQKDPSVGLNGLESSQESGTKGSGTSAEEEAQLAKLFSALLKDEKNDNDKGTQVNAVEGLAYASIQPSVKQMIISDKALLLSLFRLAEESKSNPLKYGLIVILNNLTAYKKRLTAEQEQMLKLKKMAGTLPKSDSRQLESLDHDNPLDSETAVNQRNITLVKLGIMPALHAISQQASETVRQSLAQVLRNLITPSETRGLLVQQGAVRILMPMALQQIQQQSTTSESTKTAATQALAKLSITLDPRLTFKNDRIPELVKPLIWLLDSTDQLCQFESLMALTNLGSIGDVEVSGLIVQDEGIEKMENLQFSENTMVQRAATEALCNMIFFEPVFEMYSDPQKSKSKIHLMLALCDADDFMTRRAASGALAVLSTSEDVCKMIVAQERGLDILKGLITLGVPGSKSDRDDVEAKAIEDVMSDQDAVVDHEVAIGRIDELRHRGAECVKNLITVGGKEISRKIAAQGGIQQLANLIQTSENEAVRYCAMEALKAMSNQGIPLTGK